MVERVVEIAERRMRTRLWGEPQTMKWLEATVDDMEAGRVTPFVIAERLLAEFGNLVTGKAQ